MRKCKLYNTIKEILSLIIICALGFLAVAFSVLYIETFSGGILYKYSNIITNFSTAVICLVTAICLINLRKNEKILFKLTLVCVFVIFSVTMALFLLKRLGVLDKISSADQLRECVANFGSLAETLFIIIQVLQVTVLPIPSILTVTAGVLLFGTIKGAVLSAIGIIIGSVIGFTVGRVFGVKVVKWIIGEGGLNKCLKLVEGRDKLIFSLAFLLPLFPDDMLCFVAGLTNIKIKDFAVIVVVTRFVSVLTASLSVSNMLIPYNTWWGICIWLVVFALIVLVFYSIMFRDKSNTKRVDKY